MGSGIRRGIEVEGEVNSVMGRRVQVEVVFHVIRPAEEVTKSR